MNRRRQLSRSAPLPLMALLLVGACTMLGDLRPVEGWPELKVTEHYVSHADMRDRCMRYVPALMSPDACAEFNLRDRTCHIFYSRDFPPSPAMVAHEHKRCKGYGSQSEREYLRRLMAGAQ